MLDIEFLERLIRVVDESGLDSVEIERGGTRVRVSRTPPPPPQAALAATPATAAWSEPQVPPLEGGGGVGPALPESGEAAAAAEDAADTGLVDVTSPMVGTFYRSPSPDSDPYVEVGARVSRGEVLCIIEAMKLMNELESEVEGTIEEILVENAEPVEYGQVLFRVRPA